MNALHPVAESLRCLLARPDRSIVEMVDDLLALCSRCSLQIDWQSDRCQVRTSGGAWEDVSDHQLRKSVFRAILARVAALCHEQAPNSESPYGGSCTLSVGAHQPVLDISFTNTAAKQSLEIRTMTDSAIRNIEPRHTPERMAIHPGQAKAAE